MCESVYTARANAIFVRALSSSQNYIIQKGRSLGPFYLSSMDSSGLNTTEVSSQESVTAVSPENCHERYFSSEAIIRNAIPEILPL